MSATLHLYKVLDNVDFKGTIYDNVKGAFKNEDTLLEVEKQHGYREDFTFDELQDWKDKINRLAYSDGNSHEILDICEIKRMFSGCRGLRRVLKGVQGLNFKKYTNLDSNTYKYVVTDEVLYRQGWFLTKRFFRKEITYYICNTKEQMINFFDHYIDYKSHDTRGKEAVEAFKTAWEPGMIFVCAW